MFYPPLGLESSLEESVSESEDSLSEELTPAGEVAIAL